MLYLLLLFVTINIIATQDYPVAASSTPNSPVVISKKKSAKKTVILPHASRWKKEKDFYELPDHLKNKINNRIIRFAFLKNVLDSQCCEEPVKQQYSEYIQWFYPHHGNLLITTVNEAINTGDSAGFLDFFEELVKIPEIKTKILAWQEIAHGGNTVQDKQGTIVDYLELYKAQVMQNQNQGAQHSKEILQEFLDKLQPPIPVCESD